MRRKDGVSIREISRLSGVSVATVSRVINHTGRVSEQTRERILRIMKENDYVPDMVGKSLRTSVISLVGIIVPDILVEPFAEMVRYVQKRLQPMGIMTSVCVTDNDSSVAQDYIDMLRSQRASGVIYIPEFFGHPVETHQMPVVYAFIDSNGEPPKNSATILSDRRMGGYLATKSLLDAGCRNIGIYYGNGTNVDPVYAGYLDALNEAGMESKSSYEFLTDPVYSTKALNMTRSFLQKGDFPFDGLFTTSTRLTVGVMGALNEYGLLESRSIKLASYGSLRIRDYGLMDIPMIREPVSTMADAAVDALLTLIRGDNVAVQRQVLPVQLVGSSVGRG